MEAHCPHPSARPGLPLPRPHGGVRPHRGTPRADARGCVELQTRLPSFPAPGPKGLLLCRAPALSHTQQAFHLEGDGK